MFEWNLINTTIILGIVIVVGYYLVYIASKKK